MERRGIETRVGWRFEEERLSLEEVGRRELEKQRQLERERERKLEHQKDCDPGLEL